MASGSDFNPNVSNANVSPPNLQAQTTTRRDSVSGGHDFSTGTDGYQKSTAEKIGSAVFKGLEKLSEIKEQVSKIKEKVTKKSDFKLAQRIFHVAFKGYSRSQSAAGFDHARKVGPSKTAVFEGEELAGMDSIDSASSRFKEAKVFLEHAKASGEYTQDEIGKLEILVKQREIVFNFASVGSSNRQFLLTEALEALEKDAVGEDDNVIEYKREDGGSVRSFTFVGGWKDHATSFEVQRVEKDGVVKYYFIYSNKGDGLEDKEIHGFEAEKETDRGTEEYNLTVVKYEIDKDELPDLIEGLSNENQDKETVLAHLKSHLQKDKRVIPEELKEYQKAKEKHDKLGPFGKLKNLKILKHLQEKALPYLQREQMQGTCTESCQTEQEKAMIGSKLTKELRMHTLTSYLDKINRRTNKFTRRAKKMMSKLKRRKVSDETFSLDLKTMGAALRGRITKLEKSLAAERTKEIRPGNIASKHDVVQVHTEIPVADKSRPPQIQSMSREECEARLNRGESMLRTSSKEGCFALSYKDNNDNCYHYLVEQTDSGVNFHYEGAIYSYSSIDALPQDVSNW